MSRRSEGNLADFSRPFTIGRAETERREAAKINFSYSSQLVRPCCSRLVRLARGHPQGARVRFCSNSYIINGHSAAGFLGKGELFVCIWEELLLGPALSLWDATLWLNDTFFPKVSSSKTWTETFPPVKGANKAFVFNLPPPSAGINRYEEV